MQPQLCKSCITTGLPLQQVQQISCLYKQNPAKDSLAPDDVCTIPLPAVLRHWQDWCPLCFPSQSASRDISGSLRCLRSFAELIEAPLVVPHLLCLTGNKMNGKREGKAKGMCRTSQEIMCHAGSFPLAEVFSMITG